MLASKLALAVLLVSLGSALANPVESKAAEKRDYEKDKILVVFINKAKKSDGPYTLWGLNEETYKLEALIVAQPGEYSKRYVYVQKYRIFIGTLGKVYIQVAFRKQFVIDAKIIAGKYAFANTAVNLGPEGYRFETGRIEYKKPDYDEEKKGREEEEEGHY